MFPGDIGCQIGRILRTDPDLFLDVQVCAKREPPRSDHEKLFPLTDGNFVIFLLPCYNLTDKKPLLTSNTIFICGCIAPLRKASCYVIPLHRKYVLPCVFVFKAMFAWVDYWFSWLDDEVERPETL